MTSSIIRFAHPIERNESTPASIVFVAPKYYGNTLWVNRCLELYEGPRVIGTFLVTEIVNPVLDAGGEKWIYIDGRDIHTLHDFFVQMNQKLTFETDRKAGRSLNAFRELLWGGFGVHDYGAPLHIVWIYAEKSRQALGNKYFEKITAMIEDHESNNKYLELYPRHA